MDFGSVLGQMAVGAGNSLIYGQKYQQQVAETENVKANTAMHQMSALAMKQEMEDRQGRAADFAAGMGAEGEGKNTQQAIFKGATAAEAKAGAKGDFKGMAEMAKIAEGAEASMKSQIVTQSKELQAKKEDVAVTANDYLAAPTPENAKAVINKALAAGVPIDKIPQSNAPEFGAFAKSQALGALGGKERVEFLQKAKDQDERRAETAAMHKEKETEFALRRQDTAAQRESNNLFKQEQLARLRENDQLRREAAATKTQEGGKLGTLQRGILDTTAKMSHEGARSLKAMASFTMETSGAPFSDLQGHNVMGALARLATNDMTPGANQQMTVAAAGLGRATLLMETLGQGSRAPSEAQIESMQKTVTPGPGDKPLTALYKIATAAAVIKTGLEVRNTHPNARVEGILQEDEKFYNSLPTPEQVLKAAKGHPEIMRQITGFQGTYQQSLDRIKMDLDKPEAASPTPAAAGGWSVKPKAQ